MMGSWAMTRLPAFQLTACLLHNVSVHSSTSDLHANCHPVPGAESHRAWPRSCLSWPKEVGASSFTDIKLVDLVKICTRDPSSSER